jgi:hypothetical protein
MLRKRKPRRRPRRGTASRRKRGSARARSRSVPRIRSARARLERGLEQRHLDLIGLVLVAVAVYLGGVLFLGWDGGRVGGGTETGLSYVAGGVANLVPVALADRRARP